MAQSTPGTQSVPGQTPQTLPSEPAAPARPEQLEQLLERFPVCTVPRWRFADGIPTAAVPAEHLVEVCRWLMTGTKDGTFVDAEFGMDPQTAGTRVFDAVAGKRYFRRWVVQSLEGLKRAASEPSAAAR